MATKTLQAEAVTRFSIEDVFAEGTPSAEKLAWVSGWRKLPHIKQEVLRLYDYPQQFAAALFERVEQALRRRATGTAAPVQAGHLFIRPDASQIEPLPVAYVQSCDAQAVAAGLAQPRDEDSLLRDRLEGMFLVSYQTPGGWTAVSKNVLTDVLGVGRDARMAELPPAAAEVLTLMCPQLVAG